MILHDALQHCLNRSRGQKTTTIKELTEMKNTNRLEDPLSGLPNSGDLKCGGFFPAVPPPPYQSPPFLPYAQN